VRTTGEGRGSGIPLEGEIGHIFSFREGRAAELETHRGWEKALEAAGLG